MRQTAPSRLSERRARSTAIARVVAVIAALAGPAWARSDRTLAYRRDQAWPAAVRFLVVDEHAKVTDKDADAGCARRRSAPTPAARSASPLRSAAWSE